LNPSGSTVLYSTYLGTSGVEAGNGIALNGFGNLIILGRTDSAAFPVVSPLQPNYGGGATDAFLLKIIDTPESANQCMKGGWQRFGPPAGPFRNQGDCIRYFYTGN